MLLSISSCLNHFHPIPNPTSKSSSSSQATQFPWAKEKEISWKRQCLIGVACLILGVQTEFLPGEQINHAWGMQEQQSQVSSKSRIQRWSDKRSCPPWQLNALETIVPENLPRPSARRRWEATGFSGNETSIPQITRTASDYSNKCFSL